MTATAVPLLLCATAVAVAAAVGARPAVSPRTAVVPVAEIGGEVVSYGGGRRDPVRRASVRLLGRSGNVFRETVTDTEGRYRFDDVPAGGYSLLPAKAGFVPSGVDPDRSTPIRAGDGQILQVELPMLRGAAIEGRIVTPTGEPARAIDVSAFRVAYGPLGPRADAFGTATTDDLGRYRVHSLPAGEYFLSAAPDPTESARLNGRSADPSTGFARTFYPGTAFVDQAQPVRLATGEDRRGLDLVIATEPLARVNVRVFDAAGDPGRSFSLKLRARGPWPVPVSGFLLPDDNDVTYPGVPPGDYLIVATLVGEDGHVEFGRTTLRVQTREPQRLEVRTARVEPVTGRVETAGGPLPRGLRFEAVATEFEAAYREDLGPVPTVAAVGGDGTFAFRGLFGPLLIRPLDLPPGWALTGVFRGDVDVTDRPVDFEPGDGPRPLRVVLTDRTAAVTGLVTSERGQPLSGARVVVFAEDQLRWGPASRFIRTTRSFSTGEYDVSGLLPGRYLVALAPDLTDGAWGDAATLRRLAGAARPVTLGAGERASLALTMTRRQP